jgi:hypothetical protein
MGSWDARARPAEQPHFREDWHCAEVCLAGHSLLSRYYYDLARTGSSATLTPTVEMFETYLKANPKEAKHYLIALSGGTMMVEEALKALGDFDASDARLNPPLRILVSFLRGLRSRRCGCWAVQVVGISEQLDEFMTLTALRLGVPPSELTYKNEKVRPPLKALALLRPRLILH